MPQRPKTPGTTSIRLYALGAMFLVPLSIGVVLVTSSASQGGQANQISRDLASMYAQGMDFSQPATQGIALNVAEGLGIKVHAGQGVVILSKIRMVGAADCAPKDGGKCANEGHAVVTQRYVLGNAALRSSSFGTPDSIDAASGDVRDWANDPSARATNFPTNLKPGESTYAAECYLTSPESRSGVYSRAMY